MYHEYEIKIIILYCDTIYGTVGKCHRNRLQRLQNRGGKSIIQLPKDTPTKHVLQAIKWLPLQDCIEFQNCVFKLVHVYKCLNNKASDYISNRFQCLKSIQDSLANPERTYSAQSDTVIGNKVFPLSGFLSLEQIAWTL